MVPENDAADLPEFWGNPELCRLLFWRSPEPVIIVNIDGGVIDMNDAACLLFGYTREEIGHIAPFGFLAPEALARLPEILMQENLSLGLRIELPFIRKSGEVFGAEYYSRLVVGTGVFLRWLSIRESSPSSAVEEVPSPPAKNFAWLADYIPGVAHEQEMALEFDERGRLLSANDVYLKKTGFSQKIIRDQMTIYDIIPAKMHDRLASDIGRLKHGEKIEGEEYSILTKRGEHIPIIAAVTPVMRGDVPVAFRAAGIDISEHKSTEQELLIMERLRILGELSGGVVHDFRNILAIILGYTELLMSGSHQKKSAAIAEKIARAARDGLDIIKRIDEFSQVTAAPAAEKIDLNELVAEAVELGKPKWSAQTLREGRSLEITLHLDPVPPVLGKASELREVIDNIINNAVDAIETNGVITISSKFGGEFITLAIADNGMGMDEETKNKAFEPFFTTKKERGTGLGMSVSRGIIVNMGGDMSIESEKGSGTTVAIFLPPFIDTVEEPPANGNGASSASPPSKDPGNRVLVVDDEANIRDILREFLTSAGYETVTAATVDEGLGCFNEHPFFAVVTDLNMPGKNGWDLARAIKDMAPATTIVMLSGWGSEAEAINREGNYVDIVMPKPIDFVRLIAYLDARKTT